MSEAAHRYDTIADLWHAWFGTGWPDAEDIPALERDIRALADREHPKPTARPPHPDTMAGK